MADSIPGQSEHADLHEGIDLRADDLISDDKLDAALSAAFGHSGETTEARAGQESSLRGLLREMNGLSLVPLQDSDDSEASRQRPWKTDASGRYELFPEIGRGGMGIVYRGRDNQLGRELAIKVLNRRYRDRRDALQRFVVEACVTGQLQHPGIVPVYELGEFENGDLFITMKLLQGETLSQLLSQREDSVEDRGHLLGIFDQICQTMSYAHARGVIHRDLKPANVMVGAFGEAQVMDWGLAKLVSRSGVAESEIDRLESAETAIVSAQETDAEETLFWELDEPNGTQSPFPATRAGTILGTPAYISPEQACGDIDRVNERSDVFGLGAILCEILTGEPPYGTGNGADIRILAAEADLTGAMTRLDRCGADADLIELAKACLAPDPEDRPCHAGELAEAVQAWRESLDQRLRDAELETVESRAAAEHERKRRWMTLVNASMVFLFITSASGIWQWVQNDRYTRDLQAKQDMHELALAAKERQATALQRQLEEQTEQFSSAIHKDLFAPFNLISGEQGQVDGNSLLFLAESLVATAFGDQPYLEVAIRQFLANVYRGQNQEDFALGHAEKIVELLTEHSGPDHTLTLEARDYLDRLRYGMANTRPREGDVDPNPSSLFAQSYVDVVLSDSPLGYWRLNESAGERTAHDISSNNLHGRYHGTQLTADGVTSFHSSETTEHDFVRVSNMPFPSTEVSVEFWLRTTADNRGTVLSYAAGRETNELMLDYPAALFATISHELRETGVALADGLWHHVVVTWRHSDGQLKVYRDGAPAFDGSLSRPEISPGGYLVFGQDQDALGGLFDEKDSYRGQLAEVAIYDQVLSAEQVASHFNAWRDSLIRSETNLIVNGDFEAGNQGFRSDYEFSPGDVFEEETYDIVKSPRDSHELFADYADHSNDGDSMLVVNAAGVRGTPGSERDIVWEQTVSTEAETTYAFATYLSTAHAHSPARLQVTVNGQVIGTMHASKTTGQWDLFVSTWNSGTATTAIIRIVDSSAAIRGNDFALDDIFFGKASDAAAGREANDGGREAASSGGDGSQPDKDSSNSAAMSPEKSRQPADAVPESAVARSSNLIHISNRVVSGLPGLRPSTELSVPGWALFRGLIYLRTCLPGTLNSMLDIHVDCPDYPTCRRVYANLLVCSDLPATSGMVSSRRSVLERNRARDCAVMA